MMITSAPGRFQKKQPESLAKPVSLRRDTSIRLFRNRQPGHGDAICRILRENRSHLADFGDPFQYNRFRKQVNSASLNKRGNMNRLVNIFLAR
jgi:hypothetical protein